MKKALFIGFLIVLSCHKPVDKAKNDIHANPDAYWTELYREQGDYSSHAKISKSEYEVISYIDNLPLMREAYIVRYGSVKNWQNYLGWLKANDSKQISFTSNGTPVFKRTSHYPGATNM